MKLPFRDVNLSTASSKDKKDLSKAGLQTTEFTGWSNQARVSKVCPPLQLI